MVLAYHRHCFLVVPPPQGFGFSRFMVTVHSDEIV
jgi:hypothetical protein